MSGKPYGHSAIVEKRNYGGDEFRRVTIHRKGSRSVLECALKGMYGIREVISIEAYTREEWIRCFGEGTEHGPFRSG